MACMPGSLHYFVITDKMVCYVGGPTERDEHRLRPTKAELRCHLELASDSTEPSSSMNEKLHFLVGISPDPKLVAQYLSMDQSVTIVPGLLCPAVIFNHQWQSALCAYMACMRPRLLTLVYRDGHNG